MKKNKKIVATVLIIGTITLIGVALTRELVKQSTTKNVAKYETVESSTTETMFEYTELSNGTIEITKYVGTDIVIEIPSTIDGKSVTSIGDYAFNGCSNLTHITIPSSVTKIYMNMTTFNDCNSLTNIKVDSNNEKYCDINGVLYTKDITQIIKYPTGKKEIEYTIPDSVTSIGTFAFEGCSILTNITIPDSVKSIGYMAFWGCSSLTKITIPEGVTSIGAGTFAGCSNVTRIIIPERVTSIGNLAFYGCSNLTNISIPKEVTYIGEDAIGDCNKNLTIYCKSNTTAETYAKENNILYVIDDEQPRITITASQPSPTNVESIIYTITFNEEITGLSKEKITLTNGEIIEFTAESSKIYTIEVANIEEGIQEITIPEGVCTDLLGNSNIGSIQSITIDRTKPTVGTMTMKLGNSEGTDYTNNTWANENVYISVNNGSDAESGHKSTTYRINEGEEVTEEQTLTESGTYEIVVITTDNAGNIATNEYTIKIRKPQSIFVSTNPQKETYNAYENFNKDGMVVSIKYDNGDIEETTEYTIINGENLTCKVSKIEIQYNKNSEIKTELPITVGHVEIVDTKIDAKCTETGLTEGKHCSECNKILKAQEVIQAIGHDYKGTVTAPTCLEKGYTTHKCTRCEKSYVDTYTDVLGHSFSNYISNNDATCTQDGTKTAKCDRCNEKDTITDVGSKLPHNYQNGKCTECGIEEPEIKITSNIYIIEDTYISKIQTKMTIKTFKENLQTNATEIKVYNNNGEIQEENNIVATGMTIIFKLNNKIITLKLIVAGDVTGDGKADFKDMVLMNKHRLNKTALEGEYLIAGDITEDNKLDFKDMVKINKFRLNKIVALFESVMN